MTATTIPAVFSFTSSAAVRVVQVGNEPWFVAKDIADALDYTWTGTQRISHVPEQWRGVTSVVTPSGIQQMSVMSEPGLYFFLGRSYKPKALPLQMYVAGEVLPAIRKTGSYSVQEVQQAPPAPKKLTSRSVVDLYFLALRTYAGNSQSKGALWIGLTETVFTALGISSLDGLTEENVDQAVRIISDDMAGNRSGMMAALHYLPRHSTL